MDYFKLDDALFETEFADCTLKPSRFNHEAHLRLAWIHINKYGLEKAIDQISHQLMAYVDHHSSADKFNKTLTVAAIRVVHHFINKSSANTFQDFITEFPQLKKDFKRLMAAHYTADIYNSPKAKREYMAPDLLPFT